MLAQFIDMEGDPVWINPLWVRSIARRVGPLGGKKKDGTTIHLSGEATGGLRVDVNHDAADVANSLISTAAAAAAFAKNIALDDDKPPSRRGGD